MAHDHTFDCRICGAHLDSQEALNKHNREKHSAQTKSGGSSASPRSGSSESNSQANDTTRNF